MAALSQRYKSLLENFMEFYEHSKKLLEEHMKEDSRLKPSDVIDIKEDDFKVAKNFELIPVEGYHIKYVCKSPDQSIRERLSEKDGEPIKPDVDFTANKTLGGTLIQINFDRRKSVAPTQLNH